MKRVGVVRHYGGVSAADRLAERRAKLVSAARTIWGESGINDVTVRGVCNAAGLIPRYFYEQFADRAALLFAVADEVRDQMLEAMTTAGLAEPGTVADKLRSALTALLNLIEADPHIHRIAAGDVGGVAGLAEHRARILTIVTDVIVARAPDVLTGDAPDPTLLRRNAMFIVGGTNQLITAWLENPRESATELAAHCTELCLAVVRGATR